MRTGRVRRLSQTPPAPRVHRCYERGEKAERRRRRRLGTNASGGGQELRNIVYPARKTEAQAALAAALGSRAVGAQEAGEDDEGRERRSCVSVSSRLSRSSYLSPLSSFLRATQQRPPGSRSGSIAGSGVMQTAIGHTYAAVSGARSDGSRLAGLFGRDRTNGSRGSAGLSVGASPQMQSPSFSAADSSVAPPSIVASSVTFIPREILRENSRCAPGHASGHAPGRASGHGSGGYFNQSKWAARTTPHKYKSLLSALGACDADWEDTNDPAVADAATAAAAAATAVAAAKSMGRLSTRGKGHPSSPSEAPTLAVPPRGSTSAQRPMMLPGHGHPDGVGREDRVLREQDVLSWVS